MGKDCIYCKTQIDENSVIDVCRNCGLGVWGERMFNAIIENMQNAREVGDLYQGSVSNAPQEQTSKQTIPFIEEAIKETEKQNVEEPSTQVTSPEALTEAEEILKQEPLYEPDKLGEVGI